MREKKGHPRQMTAVCERKLDTENNISRDLRKTVGNLRKTVEDGDVGKQ